MSGCSIVVPCYNERDSVVETLKKIVDSMSKHSNEYEVIVVNDASTDSSKELLEKCTLSIKLINNKYRLGYGGSLKKGILKSQYDYIVTIDADGTYPGDMIPELIQSAVGGDYDMVVGARLGENVKIPLIRKPAKWLTNKLANYLSGTKIPDLNSGFRIIKKELVEKFIKILPDGFSFTMTITLAMLTNGYSVEYLPISYFKRKGKSKIRPIRDTLNFFQLIIRTVMYFNPLRVFLPMSLSLFIAGLILLLYRIFFAKAFVTIITILFIASFQILAIGMLADLIDKRMRD